MSSKAIDLSQVVQKSEVGLPSAAARERVEGMPRPRRFKRLSVLAIGLPVDHVIDGIALTHAARPRDVIEMLRVMDFSLLLVRAGEKDALIWEMVQAVRRYWPGLRWALLAENCTDEEEILARSLGAASVTTDPRVIVELAAHRGHRK
jgi:hypothetical protein